MWIWMGVRVGRHWEELEEGKLLSEYVVQRKRSVFNKEKEMNSNVADWRSRNPHTEQYSRNGGLSGEGC